MISAPYPADEAVRLAATRALKLLDSPREPRFDRITRLAARLFNTPAAFVSLLDENRQWFKSSVGLEVSETPRAISFCGHTILRDEPLVIPDTHLDERFADNPLVTGEPCIRFYAGRVLTTRDGNRVGTLCIIDTQPREFSTEDLASLNDLADLAQIHLDEVGLDDALRLLMEADRARAEQKRMFDMFMENTPCVVFMKNSRGQYIYVNRRFRESFDRPNLTVVGKCDYEWLPEGPARQNLANDRQVLETGKPQQFLELVPTIDGTIHYWLVIKFPLPSPGKQTLLAGIAIDVTAEKEAEIAKRASDERYRDLFENACDIIICCDESGRFLYVNPAWHYVLGYSPEELSTLSFTTIIAEEEHGRARAMLERVAKGQNLLGVAFHVVTKDERKILLEGNLNHSVENGRAVVRGMFRDITAREISQQQLQASERRLAVVVQGADVGTWDWHIPSGRVDFNDRWATMIGYSPNELAPHVDSWMGLVHPQDEALIRQALEDHFAGRTLGYEAEHRVRKKSGDWAWVLDRGCVIERDEEGRPIRAAGTHLDITVRKMAESEVNRLITLQNAILDSANCSIVSTSPVGLILTFNSTAEKWLGYRAKELIGAETPALFHNPEEIVQRSRELELELGQTIQPGFETFVGRARLGLIDEREWTYIRRDGSRFPVRLSITALADSSGAVFGFLGVGRDITAEKAAAEAMRMAKEAAEVANQTKSRFLANMSHEVRTPLNGILGVNSMLLETAMSAEQRHLMEIVRESGESLLAIVNDILDFSKVESGMLELERTRFSPVDLIHETKRLHDTRAESRGLKLEIVISSDAPKAAIGDPVRIRQVLNNFVSNAIKFSSDGKITISLEIETAAAGDEELQFRFSVQDYGIGIPRDAMSRIFDAFQQADSSTTRKYGGTGLGLSICRELVTLMNGEIGVESEVGHGSTFWFTTRLRTVNPEIPNLLESPQTASALHFPGLRVLVAEDSSVNQLVISHELKKLGCEVDLVDNGRHALEAFRAAPFDLILMDCQMPEMDGYEAAAAIRSLDASVEVPIIAITANAMSGQRERCLDSGMNEYVSKPFSREKLLAAITNVLTCPVNHPSSTLPPAISEAELAVLHREGVESGVDLVVRLAEAFVEESGKTCDDMTTAILTGDLEFVGRLAHKLRGSGGNFGARHLQHLCTELELAANSGTLDSARSLVCAVEEERRRVLAALSASQTL